MKRSFFFNRLLTQKSSGGFHKFSTFTFQENSLDEDEPNFPKSFLKTEESNNISTQNPYADIEKYKVLNLREDEIPKLLLQDKEKWYIKENKNEFLKLKLEIENIVKGGNVSLLQFLKDNSNYSPLDRIIDILVKERDAEIELILKEKSEEDTSILNEDPDFVLEAITEKYNESQVSAIQDNQSSLKVTFDKDFKEFMENPKNAVAALTDSDFSFDDVKKISEELRKKYPKLTFREFLETFVGQPPSIERADLKFLVRGVSKPKNFKRFLRKQIRRESPLATKILKLWIWRYLRYKNPESLQTLKKQKQTNNSLNQAESHLSQSIRYKLSTKKVTFTVDELLFKGIAKFKFYPKFSEVYDDVKNNDPLANKLEALCTQIRTLNLELKTHRMHLQRPELFAEVENNLDISDFISSTKDKIEKKKNIIISIKKQINETVDILVLKMRVKYIAKEMGITLPLVINVEQISKHKEESSKKIAPIKDTTNTSINTSGHLVSYIDESGRKVMFEVPKTDLVKSFRQKPGRAPEVLNRRSWKGKGYALEQITDEEGSRIKLHFQYEKDYILSKKFPFELGPHVLDEWKVYERYQRRKTEKIENPDFSDSLILRKAALMNNTVDMTLNRAVQLAIDAWRKRYLPSEKSDKFTKVLGCLANEWNTISSQNIQKERRDAIDQSKAYFRQYMYRQVITKFLKEVVNQNLPSIQKGSATSIDTLKILNEVDSISSKLEAAGIDTDEMRELVSNSSYQYIEAPWFGQQFALLREMLDHLDDIIDLQVEKHNPKDLIENLEDKKATLEQHIANIASLMYFHGGRISDVRIAYQIHKIIKHSENIQDIQKREVRELFRLCFREYELFAKPISKQIFDQF